MVLDGRVRELDKFGNDVADDAADFGRRRVGPAVIDARRNLSGVCGRWYPVVLDLHRFFIAISRAVVDHDGNEGIALDPVVWSAGALPKRRRLAHAVRDLAMLPGPPAIWESAWVNVRAGDWVDGLVAVISPEDVAHWPYLLVFWSNGLQWVNVPASAISADDIASWPYTTGVLVKWVAYLRFFALACWWCGSLGWWCLLC